MLVWIRMTNYIPDYILGCILDYVDYYTERNSLLFAFCLTKYNMRYQLCFHTVLP
jgi:hypothetical protein